jgi:glycosyltransferase involved in cell wall biosynthesis
VTILLTNPFCWPFVRRGAERFLHDLTKYLAGRGHRVIALSSGPGREERLHADGALLIRKAQPGQPLLSYAGIGPETIFALQCLPVMAERQLDVIVCLSFRETAAARVAGWFTARPYVMHLAGIPSKRYFRRRPLQNLLFRCGLGGAAAVIVISRAAAEALHRDYGREGTLIHVPCDMDRFQPTGTRDLTRPRIVAAASFAERRKGARVLAKAFARLKEDVPGAVLHYAGAVPDALRRELLQSVPASLHPDIEMPGEGEVGALGAAFGAAAVAVLPSIGETFGMVLVEALACGTPVVGSRDGGIVDIVTPDVGRLFDPQPADGEATNAAGLAEAITSALAMHDDPALAARCRAHAAQFSWEQLGPRLELVFADAGAREGSKRHACASQSLPR